MSDTKDKSVYTTVDLRKNLGDALGKAHYNGEVVSISNHGKPYAAIVSEEDAAVLAAMNQLESDQLSKKEFKDWLDTLVADGRTLNEIVDAFEEAENRPTQASSSSRPHRVLARQT